MMPYPQVSKISSPLVHPNTTEVFEVSKNIEIYEKIPHAKLEMELLIKFARYTRSVSRLIIQRKR